MFWHTNIITRLFKVMLTVLIDQNEHFDNFSVQRYCVKRVYVTNAIIQYSKRKLIHKNKREWSLNEIAQVNSMLRQML